MKKINAANLKKTYYYLKRNGLRETWYAVWERLTGKDEGVAAYKPIALNGEEAERQRAWSDGRHMLFSIVVPTYRTKEEYLRAMISSVLTQTYENWELILADATEDDSVRKIAISYEDDRIRYRKLAANRGIAENTNAGIKEALGSYIGLLDHDDLLTPDALYEMALAIENAEYAGRGAKLLFSDEDKFDEVHNRYFDPNFKEKFNLDLLLSNNYICHFMMIESSLLKRLGLRKEYDGAQDYDLVLRAVSELRNRKEEGLILHIPKVLYHWRSHEASTAENPQSKLYAYEAGRRALQAFADQNSFDAEAVSLKHLGFYRLNYRRDIFLSRSDLGAVGGRLIKAHRICGGCMDADGKVCYLGLHERHGGYLHRAALTQDADAVDVRCMRIAPKHWDIFERLTQTPYRECEDGFCDWQAIPAKLDLQKVSLRICAEIQKRGDRILFDPVMERNMDGVSDGNNTVNSKVTADDEKITVVIPNFNGINYLEECMNSLLAERQTSGTPPFGVIVVDNHSTDGSEKLLRKNWDFPYVRKFFLKENTGFCHAVNLGISNARTPYVILLNNDTKVRPGFVKYLYQAIVSRRKAFSVSAKMLMWDDPSLIDDAGDDYCALGWAYARGKGSPAGSFQKREEVFSACAGAAIYRVGAFQKTGLFDERHFAYLEDLDLGYRAKIYGYRNYFEPKAEVIHYGSASTGSRYNEKKTVLAAENSVYVIWKNMPIFQVLLNLPFIFAGFIVKFLFFCRKKMGVLYLKGLWRGLEKSFSVEGRKRHVAFQPCFLINYLRIQAELYVNIARIARNSVRNINS